MRAGPRRLWAWGLALLAGSLSLAWLWWQGTAHSHEPVVLTSPSSASSTASVREGIRLDSQLGIGASAARLEALQFERAQALSANSPLWLINASRKPPCSTSLEPAVRSASAAEQARQAAWLGMVEGLLHSANTDMRGAGLYVSGRVAELMQEALEGHSPLMTEWAWAACRKYGESERPSNCSELPPKVLLDLGVGDPHTLLMAQLEDAVTARNGMLVDQTLGQLGQAIPRAWAPDRLPALAVAMWTPEMSNELRLATTFSAFGEWANARLPSYHYLTQLCHPNVLATKPGRRFMCERVARTMADQGQNVIQVFIGLRMGELLGWPLIDLQARRLEVEAGGKHFSTHMEGEGNVRRGGRKPTSCEVVTLQQRWAIAFAEKGETWFFLQQLKESGRDLSSWRREIAPYAPRPPASAPSDPL